MNNTIKKTVGLIMGTIFAGVLLAFSQQGISGAIKGVEICIKTIIPSLLPFMVVSSYIMKSNVLSVFSNGLNKISSFLFHLPKEGLMIFILSLVGGYPVGAKLTSDAIRQGVFTKNQGKRVLLFCVNSGPAFVINIVGIFMLNSKKAGGILLLALTASSLIMGVASRIFEKSCVASTVNESCNTQSPLIQSVNDSVKAVAGICGWIILFSCFMEILNYQNIPESIKVGINLMGEVTNGCSISVKSYPLCMTAFVLGFGGVCIHLQLMSFINVTGLRYKYFFVARIIHGVLSLGISAILFKIFPCNVQVFSNMGEIVPKAVSVSVPAAASMIFLFAIVVLDLAPKRKV